MRVRMVMGVVLGFALASATYGGPNTVTYQGSVVNSDGRPVADGNYNMRFGIFNVATAGTWLWHEDLTGVAVKGGLFSVSLGNALPFGPLFANNTSLWLEVAVDLNHWSGYESSEIYSPRQKLAAVPWAMDSDTLDRRHAAEFSLTTHNHNTAYWRQAGNAGTTSGTSFLGTTDNVALDWRVNNARAFRIEPGAVSPNLIGGWRDNSANPAVAGATIGGGGSGGAANRVSDNFGTVGGGRANVAGNDAGDTSDTFFATVAGGRNNRAGGADATVGGGRYNQAVNSGTTVGGGGWNQAIGYGATIAGGQNITASGMLVAVGGGEWNVASGDYATVGGGYGNASTATKSTVAGGDRNHAGGYYASVGGGYKNTASGNFATVGGGYCNIASGLSATVAGGGWDFLGPIPNVASGSWATVSGGFGNVASGNAATVSGGIGNAAAGSSSYAAGYEAKANHQGAFVWSDSRGPAFASTAQDQFSARATGGVRFVSAVSPTTVGVQLPAGGNAWAPISDRNVKENFVDVDGKGILERLAAIPLQTWNLKTQDPAIRHIGPMAQDFYAAFGVGEDDKHITTCDADGVALAAIQGLYSVLQEKIAEVAALKADKDAQLAAQQEQIAALQQKAAAQEQRDAALELRLAALETLVAVSK